MELTQKNKKISGCGSVWLERLVWDQEVAGSNPVTPTTKQHRDAAFFVFKMLTLRKSSEKKYRIFIETHGILSYEKRRKIYEKN